MQIAKHVDACRWKRAPQKPCGVIAGCDVAQEWLLEWWWERYHAGNAFPVTFVDLGLSEKAHRWCAERGEVVVIDLDMSFVRSKQEIDPDLVVLWDSWVDRWDSRKAWFKKPFALLHSPYETSIWLDLDCEVLSSIQALFSMVDRSFEVALARERRKDHLPKWHSDLVYNGGVIVFKHGSSIIEKWAQATLSRNQFFLGDDFLLSAIIREENLSIIELEEIYNWRIVKGVDLNAVIVHWVGAKSFIRECGGIKPYLEQFYRELYGKDRL